MSNNVKTLRKLAFAGVAAAFVFVGTQLRIPTAIGYINLGDAVILIASFILGPIGFFPAAIGSALSDLIAGYPQYILPTFIIKGVMGLVAGFLLRKADISLSKKLLTGVLTEVIMITGYFIFEALPFMYGPEAAAGSLLFNAIQGAAAIIIFIPLSKVPVFSKIRADL